MTLTKALGYSTMFTWTYDFGDDWAHQIKVERVDTTPAELKLQFPCAWPVRVRARLRMWVVRLGYAEFLQAIADPAHPEHGDMTAWIGRPFDPNAFNVQEAQDRLYEIKL